MTITLKESLIQYLTQLAIDLDIPDHIYEDAVIKYESVGAWLDAPDSPLKEYTPEIFPQGSFRLGTAVRPVSQDGEYDIDLVCHLAIKKEGITQKELKALVGDWLEKHPELKELLTASRRCWRLNFPGQFHMDVLPAIPNVERRPTGILLTDTELHFWQKSNPKAYAEWFYERMKVVFDIEKKALAESGMVFKSIDEVPDWKVRTPLQRAVQILKRHRDHYFERDPENCPVSIILTTLAARAYRNQGNIYDAIIEMARDMPSHIENRDGNWWVPNPVEPDENFADKWNEKPERREAFLRWLVIVRRDLEAALASRSFKEAGSILEKALEPSSTDQILKSFGRPGMLQPIKTRRVPPQVPAEGSASHVQRLPYPETRRYTARVLGSVHHKTTGKKLWDLADRSVPKDVMLRFAVSTSTPAPYTVKWQVVNTGAEAIAAQQLRGEFYDSEAYNQNVRTETTFYLGTHWVQAFIIKDGVCVARSEKKMVKVREFFK